MPTIPEKKIIDFMSTRKSLLDGIAVTGGEPTLQKDLLEFAKKMKNMGFLFMIETNGSNPRMIKELVDRKLVDYIAMDIKAPLKRYEKVTGKKVNKKNIQKSIDIIRNSGVDYEFRTTVIPKFFKKEDAVAIGKWLKESKNYYLQQFMPENNIEKAFERVKPYPPERLKEFTKIMNPYFKSVKVRSI